MYTSKALCTTCQCLIGAIETESCSSPLIADGHCNDETNNAECNYDSGDCCININTDYCSECKCYYDQNCAAGFTPPLVGDGYCNNETNNAGCNYDGGDCCGDDVDTDECNLCICKQQ